MKKLVLSMLAVLLFSYTYAQTNNMLADDCNPKLNEKEISYLSRMFPESNFDFKNKMIGFAAHKVKKICKVSSFELSGSWPINKKEFFKSSLRDNCQATFSKLIVLNEEQKKITKGFDAIVLTVKKKKEKKIDARMIDRFVKGFGYRTLNYPDNLHLVGNDNTAELTHEEEILLTRIYHHSGFNFKSKKIAFINPHLERNEAIRTKAEFIQKIKKHLETDFLYPASENLLILSEEEKQQTGGYDAIIVYQNKRLFKEEMIKILRENKL